MKMKEFIFQNEIMASFRKYFPNAHYYKIPDETPDKRGVIKTIKRPYDIYFFYNKKFHTIELKQMKKCESFNFNKLEKHQSKYLKEVHDNGGNACVIINYRFKPSKSQLKKYTNLSNRSYNFCFGINIKNYNLLKSELIGNGHKSIPIGIILDAYKNPSEWTVFEFIEHKKLNSKSIWRLDQWIK